jgi:hypothetical protein
MRFDIIASAKQHTDDHHSLFNGAQSTVNERCNQAKPKFGRPIKELRVHYQLLYEREARGGGLAVRL